MVISIITATYNSEKTLSSTIESILSQTHKDIEYIIVDGASTDGTMAIVEKYRPKFGGRIRVISEPDKGIYDAMNKGIKMATGEIVGILNSDDFYYDNTILETIAETFEQSKTDCLFGNLIFVEANAPDKIVRTWKGRAYEDGAFLKGWHPAHPTFYVRRNIYERYGYFDISLSVSADFELMLRFIEKYKIKTLYIDKCFVKMRYGGESTGSLQHIIQGNRNVLKSFKKNGLHPNHFYLLRRLWPKAWNLVKVKTAAILP